MPQATHETAQEHQKDQEHGDGTPYDFAKLDALRQLRELLPDRRILFDLVDDDAVLEVLCRDEARRDRRDARHDDGQGGATQRHEWFSTRRS